MIPVQPVAAAVIILIAHCVAAFVVLGKHVPPEKRLTAAMHTGPALATLQLLLPLVLLVWTGIPVLGVIGWVLSFVYVNQVLKVDVRKTVGVILTIPILASIIWAPIILLAGKF